MNESGGALSSRYEKLEAVRAPFLKRARDNAIVTVPAVMPKEGSRSDDLYTPFQSMGAYGTNNLASKWMLALFPPHRPFYRLFPETGAAEGLDVNAKRTLDEAFAKAEGMIFDEFSSMRTRPVAYRSFRHLIITGNFLLRVKEGVVQGYALDQYVTVRAYNGDLLEAILCEAMLFDSLPEDVQEELLTRPPTPGGNATRGVEPGDEVKVFTQFKKIGNQWHSHQEVAGVVIEGSEESYGVNKRPPILALRWYGQDGEDYGRAFVDDFYGDLAAAEDLSDNLLTFAGIASKVVFTKDPAGFTDEQEVRDAKSGDIVLGDADEFKALAMAEKVFDFQAASARLEEIEQRIKYAFLLNTAGQRDAERVTAEEVRAVMEELQAGHAGTLSNFAEEYQLPLVELIMDDMKRREVFPELKKVKVAVVTGVDAMSRNQEVHDMAEALGLAQQLVGPEVLWSKLDADEVVRRILIAKGVKLMDLERSAEDAAKVRAEQQQNQLIDKATAPVAGAVAREMTKGNQAE